MCVTKENFKTYKPTNLSLLMRLFTSEIYGVYGL